MRGATAAQQRLTGSRDKNILDSIPQCGGMDGPGLSPEQYARFRAEWLVIREAYPNNPPGQKALVDKAMENLGVDSVALERFFTYYEKRPEKWSMVEKEIAEKIQKMKKEGDADGRGQSSNPDG
jgi:hypothetical protein